MTISRRSFVQTGLLAGAFAVAAPGLLKAQTPRMVRFATEGAFPPFNQTSPDGTITGFEPDLVKAISELTGFKYEMAAQAWDGMIQGLTDGKYDAVVDGVSVTPARMEVIDFSLPYTTGGSAFVTMNETGFKLPLTGSSVDLEDKATTEKAMVELVAALEGKTVAVQVSTIQSAFLKEYLAPKGITIREYPNGPDTFQDLMNSRADTVMASVTNLTAFLEKHKDTSAISGPEISGGIMGKGSAIAIKKGDTELKAMLDKGMTELSRSGALTALSVKWFGIDITPKY